MAVNTVLDMVMETTAVTGTGTMTLIGAVQGYQAFSAIGNGNTCIYSINGGVNWEVGIGTYTTSGTTLSRDKVLASSNAGALVNFPAGTKLVYLPTPAASVQSFAGYIYDLRLTYTSTSAVLVNNPNGRPGTARDSTDSIMMSLTNQPNISITSHGTILGNDSFTGPGTIDTSAKTGTGHSTTFKSSFGTKSATGNITTSNVPSTTITGANTLFLTEVTVGDLVGNSSAGWSNVTAIASDTSLTVGSNLTLNGVLYTVIETPTIKNGTNGVTKVLTITSDTALTVNDTQTTTNGQTYSIGKPVATSFLYVFIATGSSGTSCFVSTQRTTPFGITGYATGFRRIGFLWLDSSANIQPFNQNGLWNTRKYQYEIPYQSTGTVLLSAGQANATWTAVVASGAIPPTSKLGIFNLLIITGATLAPLIYYRARNSGSATVSRNLNFGASSANAQQNIVMEIPLDGAQCLDYSNSAAPNVSPAGAYIFVDGCVEEL